MSDLIDTTEMYLRTIFELGEEGITPIRARIAERLHQSGPTVSQTVARMERDGLLVLENDRHIVLTDEGRERAVRVMRKHRLAERLLSDVIDLDWELVHDEACRWEHVISDEVELKLVRILGEPESSPYGNPIPGLDELGLEPVPAPSSCCNAVEVLKGRGSVRARVLRLSEHLQTAPHVLAHLHDAGVRPGADIALRRTPNGVAFIPEGRGGCELSTEDASLVFVVPAED